MKYASIALLAAACLGAQSLKTGAPAPPITAPPLDPGKPFPGWEAFRGSFVVVDFWATWCGPCLPALTKMANLEKEFAPGSVQFVTVASDTRERVTKYFSEKGLSLRTFVESETDRGTANAFGIHIIPASVLIDREGRLIGVTPSENVTAEALRKVIAGEKVALPGFQRLNNITWDEDEITWQDGVLPLYQVVIKPLEVSGGGVAYKPGGNRISGDGVPVEAMIQTAWQTDSFHVQRRSKLPDGWYRFAATVPKGRESELLPALQDALQRTFGFRAHWEELERNALVLTSSGSVALKQSESEPLFQFMRGKITMRRQTMSKLAETLPNWLQKPVIDETHLSGPYDFDLEYRSDSPRVLTDALRERYGLLVSPARRQVRMLVVDSDK
jgi:uncharacterized protein (TIGR03435 family)